MTASTAPAIAPATYRIDPARSTVRFVSKAMFGLFRVRGTFTVREGAIVVADDITRSTVTATMDAASIDTANTRRDHDLRAKKYLDTARHPDILFASREVTADSVTGILRLHGISQRVTLSLAPESTPDGFRFTTTTRLDRYAFGVTGGKGLVARHVDVDLEIVASRG
jgi:polyisoprenoid-binding protein YceI